MEGELAAPRYVTLTLAPGEFISRFLLHVLPKGFHRIRHYGLLARRWSQNPDRRLPLLNRKSGSVRVRILSIRPDSTAQAASS
jgi:hypothetical protein